MLILAFSKTVVQRSNINSAVNIACKFKCNISKSKSVLSECNDLYFIAIAFIAFTLHEIKQCPVFFGTPGMPVGSIPAKGHLYTDVNSVF
jgi:hypothetical protein